jgi:hypothetical protein
MAHMRLFWFQTSGHKASMMYGFHQATLSSPPIRLNHTSCLKRTLSWRHISAGSFTTISSIPQKAQYFGVSHYCLHLSAGGAFVNPLFQGLIWQSHPPLSLHWGKHQCTLRSSQLISFKSTGSPNQSIPVFTCGFGRRFHLEHIQCDGYPV